MRSLRIGFLGLCLLLLACQPETPSKKYLFLGHTYDWKSDDNNRVDPRIAALKPKLYDGIWMGGDICARSSGERATLVYLDSLLHLGASTTHWAVGNHDLTSGHPEMIPEFTHRPSFYQHYFDGIHLMVWNTCFEHPQLPKYEAGCEEMNAQYQLIKNVCDTLQKADYFVILHHHALLTNSIARNDLDVDTLFHYYRPKSRFSCEPAGSFEELVYPLLTEVQQRGVQVILIGGDVGQRCKTFSYQSQEGIWFLGSGINNSMGSETIPPWVTNLNPDSILVFEHQIEKGRLSWKFYDLDEMVQEQKNRTIPAENTAH
ncbi:MAG: metallophosphoesterase [Bacteroidota bacterium]